MVHKKSKEDRELERGTTSVSVRLDDELIAWLDQVAADENRSRANLIETLLKQARAARGVKQ
ncbi:MAG: ribbon-helix-helix protein, CopG family [Candidatus Sulfotelmatobacter sp.]